MQTEHKDQRNGIGKYLLPTGMVIITIIAIAGRFVCALERVRNTPTADTAAYTETDVVTEEPPEAPAAPVINIQTQELVTTEDLVIINHPRGRAPGFGGSRTLID